MRGSRSGPESGSTEIHSRDPLSNPGHAARGAVRDSARSEPAPQATVPSLWGIGDVAWYLKVPESSIYRMTARKAAVRIPHIRIGGKLRFRRSDIDRWLTFLSESNIETLERVQRAVRRGTHGDNSQTQSAER